MTRTFVIGDIHGDDVALERLLGRLPSLSASDTVVFLGDYVDRGPDSRYVVERVRDFAREAPCKTVLLRGNHEDAWLESYERPNMGFLLHRANGCYDTYRSFTDQPPIEPEEAPPPGEIERFMSIRDWMPSELIEWFATLALWYEDEHALYVHAALEREGEGWKHPSRSSYKHLLWSREQEFFRGYKGKLLVFGHTKVSELPRDHLGVGVPEPEGPLEVWRRGDLVGIDTACGKGGHLTAIELPAMHVYDSR